MVVHIFPVEKFTEPFVNFINSNFDFQSHRFYLYGNYKNDCLSINNMINVNVFGRKLTLLFDRKLRRDLKNADSIVIHNFNELPVAIIISHLSIRKKCAVVFWGGDIYIHRQVLDGTRDAFVKVIEFLKKRALKGIPLFLTFCHNDYLLAKEWYGIDGECIDILYPSTVNKKEIETIYDEKQKHEHQGIYILLGNSATASNQHIEALDFLRQYACYDINIYVPLAYGDMDYRDKVIEYGTSLFSDKFHPITNFMTPNEYATFLSFMDVAIFNNDRQQATGNIEIVAYLGAKVYLRPDTVMWDHYVNRDKRRFFSTFDIKNSDINIFSNYIKDDFLDNHKYFSNIWDENYLKEIWKRVFKKLEDVS